MERGRGEPNFGLPPPPLPSKKVVFLRDTQRAPPSLPQSPLLQKENFYFFLFLKIGEREVRGGGSILPGAKEKNEERERG